MKKYKWLIAIFIVAIVFSAVVVNTGADDGLFTSSVLKEWADESSGNTIHDRLKIEKSVYEDGTVIWH